MAAELKDSARELRTLCALALWFDRELLLGLAAVKETDLAELLSGELVVPAEDYGNGYRLRDDVRDETMAWLREHQPRNELLLHTRLFHSLLQLRSQEGSSERAAALEAACVHHLDKLFFLLAPREEWQTIAGYVDDLKAAGLGRTRHLHQVSLYEASVAINTQRYDEAVALLTALLKQPKLTDDLRIRAVSGLAQIAIYRGQYDQALANYQHVHSLATATENRYYQGVALINMSMIYNDLEAYEEALDLSLQSLQVFRALHDRYRESIALYEIGNTALQLGRWPLAEEHFRQAIGLSAELGLQARLSNLYWGYGLLHHLLGDVKQSEVAYERALAIAESPDHREPRVATDVLWYLGFLYTTQARWDEALDAYDRAVSLAAELGRTHWLGLIHYQRGNLFARQRRIAEAYSAYETAIEHIETLRHTLDDDQIKIRLLGTTQHVYEAIVLLCLEQGRHSEAFHYVERARSRALLDSLARKEPELYRVLQQPVATLADVQAQLSEDALLVEYFTTGVVPRSENIINKLPASAAWLREYLTPPAQVIVFVVGRNSLDVRRSSLDPNRLRPAPGDPDAGQRFLRDRLLAQLYEHLINPFAHALRHTQQLFLIPHGPLHYVPFPALRAADGAYLLDVGGPALALAPSATILLKHCLGRESRPSAGCLALGYNDPEQRPLQYAEIEAGLVAQLMGGQAWVGAQSKSEQLINYGAGVRILHIAGHAFYIPHDPLGSHLVLGAGDTLSARAIIQQLRLNAELVTLSSCTSGLSHVASGDELLGLQRAFLFAGAAAVICAQWETTDLVALLLMERFYLALRAGLAPAAALQRAQIDVREMTGRTLLETLEAWSKQIPHLLAALVPPALEPEQLDNKLFSDPTYWAAFTLVGRPY